MRPRKLYPKVENGGAVNVHISIEGTHKRCCHPHWLHNNDHGQWL
jgi:hypothetical protein